MKSYKLLLTLLLILSVRLVSSQNSRSYRPYYEAINGAELSVVDLNFAQAFDIYSKAFKQFEKHQKSDLYNATLCAILIGEVHQASLWMKELVTKGTTLNGFKANTFKRLLQNVWDEIKAEYDSLNEIYSTSIDLTYKAALDTMRSREQRLVHGGQSRYDSLIYEHAKALHGLIVERGIPKVSMFEGQPFPFDVVRHHFGLRNQLKYYQQNGIDISAEPYRSMDFSRYDLEPLLIDAVFKGDLSPNFVAGCMEHSQLDSTRQLGAFRLIIDLNTKTIKQVVPDKMNLELVDNYRKSLGLESTRDAARKDIEVALLYNQEKFPFDELYCRFKEIGYTKTAMKALKPGGEEFDKKAMACNRIFNEMRKSFFNEGFEVNGSRDNKPIYVENKWKLLTQFQLNQTVIDKEIIPPLR